MELIIGQHDVSSYLCPLYGNTKRNADCGTLYTPHVGCVDDVMAGMLPYNEPHYVVTLPRQHFCNVMYGLTPLLLHCMLQWTLQ